MDERFKDFNTRIKAFKRLPVLPQVMIRLIDICNDENIAFQELSRTLAMDAGLTSRVLHLANSSYYRNQEKISHIDQALLRMGRQTVKNLVFSAAVHQVFQDNHGYDPIHIKRFWRHSLLSATIARMIAVKIDYREPEQAFFAGMIHDIGRLVLSANFPEACKEILDLDPNESKTLLDEERKICASHPEIGAWLLSQWNIDSFTIDAVLYHHETADRIARAFPLVKIVFSANILAEMTESSDVRCDDIMGFFSLTLGEMTDLVVRAEEEMDALAQSLGIDIGPKGHRFSGGNNDEENNRVLTTEVEDMAMLFATLQALTEVANEEEMLKTVQDGLRILLDAQEALLFLYDVQNQLLINHGDPYADNMHIPWEQQSSIIVRCLIENRILSSFEEKSGDQTIMDKQLAGYLGKQGMICVPLIARQEKVGVAVVGVDPEDEISLKKRTPLLKLFAHTVAAALHADRMKQEHARQVQAERLAAVQALMRRVAHEINNPLGIIKNFLLILSSKLGDHNNGVQKEIKVIREEIDRITRILPELSIAETSKRRVKSTLDLNGLIKDMTDMFAKVATVQRGIHIQLQLAADLPKITVDKDGIKQVLLNLLKNAVEALPQGGNIYIETASFPHGADERNADGQNGEPKEIRMVFRDDGPGIDQAIQEKLFEPCVSSKGEGHSGIGLSVVYQIIKEQGGDVTCTSNPGQGAAFTLTLPIKS